MLRLQLHLQLIIVTLCSHSPLWCQLREWLLGCDQVAFPVQLPRHCSLSSGSPWLSLEVLEWGCGFGGGSEHPAGPGSPALIHPCRCSGCSYNLLMPMMGSLTQIQDDALGADVCNLLAGDLNWRNTDIWHRVQPTELSES